MAVERFLHREAWRRLWAHLSWVSASVVSWEIRLTLVELWHVGWALLLLLFLLLKWHSHHMLVWSLRLRTGPHEVHQELCVAVVAGDALFRPSRTLARGSLVLAYKILQKLVWAGLGLRPGRKYLLHVVRWWTAKTFSSTSSILLEWLGRSHGSLLHGVAGLRHDGCRKGRRSWGSHAESLLLQLGEKLLERLSLLLGSRRLVVMGLRLGWLWLMHWRVGTGASKEVEKGTGEWCGRLGPPSWLILGLAEERCKLGGRLGLGRSRHFFRLSRRCRIDGTGTG
jgi:hypothetical protein